MAEYINREEFIQHIEESDLPDMEKRAVIALVRHMPAADVVEVVHGEWIKNEDDCWWEGSESRFCSCCGHGINVECIPWFKFCHNCGAKMDGGRKETDGRFDRV